MTEGESNDKVKKYIPYGLGVIAIFVVIVILTLSSQKIAQSQRVTTTPPPSTTTHQCAKSDWIGDDYCDDETNNEKCDYDGGDCCLEEILADYCSDCTCHETGKQQELKYTIETTTRVRPTGDSSNFEFSR